GDIQYDVKQVNIQDTHYIVAATASGNVYFYNNKGRLEFRNETAASVSFRNPIALQHAPDDAVTAPHVLTTDTSGVLRQFYFEKRQSADTLAGRSAGHYFDAMNITGSALPELVFADGQQLTVYNNAGDSLIYHYDFGGNIERRPLFF